MTFYSNISETAERLIADKGRSVTIQHKTPGTYDPATDTVTGAGMVDTPAKAVFTQYKANEIDGTLIQSGDKKAIVHGGVLPEIQQGDIILDGSDRYRVVEIMSVQPGDTLIIYKLQVRK